MSYLSRIPYLDIDVSQSEHFGDVAFEIIDKFSKAIHAFGHNLQIFF